MIQSLRVQLSLLFTDENLYNGLIVQLKENKSLSPLIIKLLSSYFYNDTVRSEVDGFDSESIESEVNSDYSQCFERVRENLVMMGILSDSAKDVLSNGMDDVMDTLNSVARQTGGSESYDSEFGRTVPAINMKQITPETSTSYSDSNSISSSNIEEINKRLNTQDKELSSIRGSLDSIKELIEGISRTGLSSEVSTSNEVIKPQSKVGDTVNIEDKIEAEVKVPNVETVNESISEVEESNNHDNEEKIDGTASLKSFLSNGFIL